MEFFFEILGSEEIQTALLGLFGLFLTIIINRVAGAFTAATGINIEAKHREALHEAVKSGVESALGHGVVEGIGTLKAHAIAHAHQSVPDAMRALVPGDTVLDRIAERYALEGLNRLGIVREGDLRRPTPPTTKQSQS